MPSVLDTQKLSMCLCLRPCARYVELNQKNLPKIVDLFPVVGESSLFDRKEYLQGDDQPIWGLKPWGQFITHKIVPQNFYAFFCPCEFFNMLAATSVRKIYWCGEKSTQMSSLISSYTLDIFLQSYKNFSKENLTQIGCNFLFKQKRLRSVSQAYYGPRTKI